MPMEIEARAASPRQWKWCCRPGRPCKTGLRAKSSQYGRFIHTCTDRAYCLW